MVDVIVMAIIIPVRAGAPPWWFGVDVVVAEGREKVLAAGERAVAFTVKEGLLAPCPAVALGRRSNQQVEMFVQSSATREEPL